MCSQIKINSSNPIKECQVCNSYENILSYKSGTLIICKECRDLGDSSSPVFGDFLFPYYESLRKKSIIRKQSCLVDVCIDVVVGNKILMDTLLESEMFDDFTKDKVKRVFCKKKKPFGSLAKKLGIAHTVSISKSFGKQESFVDGDSPRTLHSAEDAEEVDFSTLDDIFQYDS